ncbi:hypothetical protein ACQUZK_08955 [Streptococcus pyogenes]|uniref:hypothetical protein n=1 Tax=Streptococcus pyogenes TaxID=1314 RepID=UPI003DA01598
MRRNPSFISIALAACALGYTGVAGADDITIDPVPFVPSASRAEVRAEMEAFKKSGVNPWSIRYNPTHDFRSARTRAEVTAEYIRERDAVAAMNGEDSGSRYLAEVREAGRSPVYLANQRLKDVADHALGVRKATQY